MCTRVMNMCFFPISFSHLVYDFFKNTSFTLETGTSVSLFLISRMGELLIFFPYKDHTIFRLLTKSRYVKQQFDVLLRMIRFVHFLSRDGKTFPMREKMVGKIVFSRQSGHYNFDVLVM